MTAIATNIPQTLRPAAFDGLLRALRNRALYRRTVNELQSLTGRELADIGLTRSMIRSAARDVVAQSV